MPLKIVTIARQSRFFRRAARTVRNWPEPLLVAALLSVLWVVSQHNYLLFHDFVEILTTIVACAVFMLFWNARRFLDDGFFLFLGIACLCGGLCDLFHVLSYPGVSQVPGWGANESLQVKTAGRWIVSLSFVVAPLLVRRRISLPVTLLAYGAVVAVVLGSVFYWRVFPVCFAWGAGITPFEKFSRAAGSVLFLAAIATLLVRRKQFDAHVFRLLAVSLFVSAVSETASAVSTGIDGSLKVFAHLSQVAAVYFLYKAFIEVALMRPYDLLFRSQEALREQQKCLDESRLEALLQLERTRQHEALSKSEARLRCALSIAQTGLWEADCSTHESLWSAEMYRIFALDPQTPASYETMLGVVHPEDRETVMEFVRSSDHNTEGATRGLDHRLLLADGRVRHVHEQLQVTRRDAAGAPLYVVGTLTDITDRKLAEEALRRKDREDQQRRAQRMELVGQLAGGIAHEFNNLLQAIDGYTKFAMRGLSPDEERYQDLAQVVKASDRAAALTRRLLGFSRQQVLERRHLDPNQLLADLQKLVRPLIGEHIEITMILGEDISALYADPGELTEALLNLCLNARDAMPEGGQLLLKTENVVLRESWSECGLEARPGPYVAVSVTDTGCGMSSQVRERIFEPFYTTKEVGKGTGMGLANVYGIIRQHGGTIHVYSEPGKGTTFRLFFPAREGTQDTCRDQEQATARGGSETILIAEDEPMVRALAARTLSRAGYTVLLACDGQKALRILADRQQPIDLILLDAVMPKLTGSQVLAEIKCRYCEVKVILCTGYDPESVHCNSAQENGLRLIQKPFQAETLLQVVREVLDQQEVEVRS
ncbi:MAG: MASE3 domain-containing protein [Thermoguttaceae bacterium]|jgi:PAS domain S-box-containing protein